MSVNGVASALSCLEKLSIIDLSHTLIEGIPHFPTHTAYRHLPCVNPLDPALMFSLELHEHTGTHVDAPMHYLKDISKLDISKHAVSAIRVKDMFGTCKVLDIKPGEDNLISKTSLIAWENQNYTSISDYDFLFFYFGWEHKWSADQSNVVFTKKWPGLSRDCCEYILEMNPRIKGVGTDCLGLDKWKSSDIPAHDLFLQNNILIYENLNNLSKLTEVDQFLFMAFPLKIFMGSGSPIRAIAFLEER
ncbi:MAG: cyclase family protein [Actinomycetota bacterium]|nr:cyclase family protein [Actinomycetota bacterium]